MTPRRQTALLLRAAMLCLLALFTLVAQVGPVGSSVCASRDGEDACPCDEDEHDGEEDDCPDACPDCECCPAGVVAALMLPPMMSRPPAVVSVLGGAFTQMRTLGGPDGIFRPPRARA